MAKQEITTQNFNKTLKTLVSSMRNQRDRLQEFLEFGLSHAKEHGDMGYLSRILNATIEVNSIRTSTVKDYIKSCMSNVKWGRTPDGSMAFMKEDSNKANTVTMPTAPWYEFNNSGVAQADMDVMAQVKSLLSRIVKAEKEGKVKDADAARRVEQALTALVSVPKAEEKAPESQAA